MSNVVNILLSIGGQGNIGAAWLHGIVWSRRLVDGRSDAPEMALLDDINLDGHVALDVGAHAGNWTMNLARRVGSRGRVVAYEALPHYGKSLAIALRLLRIRNVTVRNVAVGDGPRTIKLRWRSESKELLTGKTHIDTAAGSSDGVVEVQMTSLDRDLTSLGIAFDEVAFVKIDVEGAELDVLRGAHQLLGVGRPVIYLEAEPAWVQRMGHTVADIFEEMRDQAYDAYLISDLGVRSTDLDDYLSQYAARSNANYNNVLFLPKIR